MTIEMADRTKSIPKGIVENMLVKFDKFIFLVDFVILDIVKDFRMPIILGRPLLGTTHDKVDVIKKLISLEVGNEKVVLKIKNNLNETLIELVHWCRAILQKKEMGMNFRHRVTLLRGDDQCDEANLPKQYQKKCYWGCLNDDKRLDVAWEGMSPKDWVRVSHGKVCAMTKERILKDYGRREPNQEETIDLNPNFDPTQEENSNTEEDCEDLKNLGRKN
ncbi:hypothetical protein Tco_1576597 [Tanacetum coccineum]